MNVPDDVLRKNRRRALTMGSSVIALIILQLYLLLEFYPEHATEFWWTGTILPAVIMIALLLRKRKKTEG